MSCSSASQSPCWAARTRSSSVTSAMMVSWNGLYMASLVKKLFILFLVCHDLRQIVTHHCDSFHLRLNCRGGCSARTSPSRGCSTKACILYESLLALEFVEPREDD